MSLVAVGVLAVFCFAGRGARGWIKIFEEAGLQEAGVEPKKPKNPQLAGFRGVT